MGQLTSTINFTRYELTSVTDYRNDKFARQEYSCMTRINSLQKYQN